jgi:hypothetical protein
MHSSSHVTVVTGETTNAYMAPAKGCQGCTAAEGSESNEGAEALLYESYIDCAQQSRGGQRPSAELFLSVLDGSTAATTASPYIDSSRMTETIHTLAEYGSNCRMHARPVQG